ncbi:MAG: hydrogenase maturation protease, partial [Clostridiales bacterium]
MGWRTQLQEMVPAGVPIAVLGVGSVLCGDDAAGMEVIARLEQYDLPGRILLCAGSTAPENFTGVIKKFAPTYLIVIDAAYMEKPPGTIAIIPAEAIDGMGFSTHMLPMSVMLNYLRQELQ